MNARSENEKKDKISIIIPVFNEEHNIKILADKILSQLNNEHVEIIFVDDGSTDNTLQVLRSLTLSNIYYASFSRNFGHQNALKAGFDFASGDCVICMDGDLQHPTEILPQMISLWRQGIDIVHGIRKINKKQSFFKKTSSSLFYKLFTLCTPVPLRSGMADFRLMDRKVVEVCKKVKGNIFFWRGFIPQLGFQQVFIDYKCGERHAGSSKYSLKKMLKLAWNGISTFSTIPLRLSFIVGMVGILMSLIYSIHIIWEKFNGLTVPGWSSVIIMVMFFGAMNLLTLGILGDYMGKIFINSIKTAPYVLKELNISAIQHKD